MVMAEICSCVFVLYAIEESDDYVLRSTNISETHAVDFMRPSIACSVAPPRCIALAPPLCGITDVSFQSIVRLLRRVLCSTDELHPALAAAADAAADHGGCSRSEEFGSEPAGQVSDESSSGPTSDGRIKPDLVAPGVNICSGRAEEASAPIGFTCGSGTWACRGSGTAT